MKKNNLFNSNKKASTMKWLVAVIITLVIIVVVSFLVYEIKNITEKTVRKGVCRVSVEKLAFGKKIPVIGQQLLGAKLDCPREKIVFKKKETDDEKSKKLVTAIENCLWNFGEGKRDFTEGNILLDQTNCAICAKISFDKGAVFDPLKFSEYTKEHVRLGTEETYAEYFNGINYQDNETEMSAFFGVNPLLLEDNSKEYYLFFYVIQRETGMRTFIGALAHGKTPFEAIGLGAIGDVFEWMHGFKQLKFYAKTGYDLVYEGEDKQTSGFILQPTDYDLAGCENLLN